MKGTIKTRLFLGIFILTFFATGASWLINLFFSDDFYLFMKKAELNSLALEIEKIVGIENFSDMLAIERTEREQGVYISLFDVNDRLLYDTQYYRGSTIRLTPIPPFPPSPSAPPRWLFKDEITILNKTIPKPEDNLFLTGQVSDAKFGIDFLEYAKIIKNGYILRLAVSVAPIKESAVLASHLAWITGLAVLIIGSLFALIYTNWFTKPIIALKTIAEHMARLDFSRKYQSTRDDEIGDLGRSINTLSTRLHKAITRLEKSNKELTADIQRERKLETMRKDFISSVSHELKTPLSIIQGYAEGLRSNIAGNLNNKIEYCNIIIDEAIKMNHFIKDLMNLSTLDSGTFSLQYSYVDINRLMEKILAKYTPRFDARNVQFRQDIQYHGYVYADPIRIEQVLVNYFNNALNHLDDKRTIHLKLTHESNRVRIAVYNTGRIIPAEELENIWVSFYKVDKARTREYGGSGLGLSIVRSIMNLHNTAYGVINRKQGVEFWFELNKREQQSASASA